MIHLVPSYYLLPITYFRDTLLALWFVQISAQYSYMCVDCICFRMNRIKSLAVFVYVSFRLILKSTLWL